VVASLEEIGCTVTKIDDLVQVIVPSWRPDITHKTDLVEEVARLIGYDKIPSRLPVAPPGRGLTSRQKLRRRVLSGLTGAGFVEVLNYPFVSAEQNGWMGSVGAVELENPMQSEASFLRTSLVPGLIAAAARNISRGSTDIALLEEGSVFLPNGGSAVTALPAGNERPSEKILAALKAAIPLQPRLISGLLAGNWLPQSPGQHSILAGYPQALGALEIVMQQAAVSFELEQLEIVGLHPGRAANVLVAGKVVGFVGEVHPELASQNHLPRSVGVFELNLDEIFALAPDLVQAQELGVMTFLTQDLSLVVDVQVSAADLIKSIVTGAGELLEEIRLVDDYRGKGLDAGQKSLTFSLLYRANDRTLTQAEATAARDQAVELANQQFGATLRG
jgi:phenylalanyl-tRNA synthetase beta chain